ncbi:MAG: hypothetical protein R3B70_39800 [Polyangiaceae bacterium]
MPMPTETALKGRARALLEAMTDRARWMYAVPRDHGEAQAARAMLEEQGLQVEESDDKAGVVRLVSSNGKAAFVLFDSAELEVLLVEATGEEAPGSLGKVLEKTGFYAQSQLLKTALDVRDPEAPKALRTLAHMVVAWDEDWSDLFLLHLASPDPIARHEAAMALTIATMVARDAGPALALLEEAHRREKFPKLKDTLHEAMQVISGMAGDAVSPAEGGEEAS